MGKQEMLLVKFLFRGSWAVYVAYVSIHHSDDVCYVLGLPYKLYIYKVFNEQQFNIWLFLLNTRS